MKNLVDKGKPGLVALLLSIPLVGAFSVGTSLAATTLLDSGGTGSSASTSTSSSSDACDNTTTTSALKNCVQQNKITKDLQVAVNFLSAGVGIVVIGLIIVGGIQYSIAGDNPQATTAAKERITNALIALVAFLFIFAFIQWLIPGGLFGSGP